MVMSLLSIYGLQARKQLALGVSLVYVANAYKGAFSKPPEMYNPQVAKEARDFMNYTYIAMLVCGGLMVVYAIWALITILSFMGMPFVGIYFIGSLTWAVILLAAAAFGLYTAIKVIQPKVMAEIDQGRYSEAYSTSSAVMTIIGAFAAGIIPGIILVLANQKLSEVSGPLPTAPPPPPPA